MKSTNVDCVRLVHAAGGVCRVSCSSIAISSSCESLLCSAGLEIRFNYSCSLLRLLPLCQHGGLDFDVFFLSQLLVFANLLRSADEVLHRLPCVSRRSITLPPDQVLA